MIFEVFYPIVLSLTYIFIFSLMVHKYMQDVRSHLLAFFISLTSSAILSNIGFRLYNKTNINSVKFLNAFNNLNFLLWIGCVLLTFTICVLIKQLQLLIFKAKNNLNQNNEGQVSLTNIREEIQINVNPVESEVSLSNFTFLCLFYGFSIQFLVEEYYNTRAPLVFMNLSVGVFFHLVAAFNFGLILVCSSLKSINLVILAILYIFIVISGSIMGIYGVSMYEYLENILDGTSFGCLLFAVIFEISIPLLSLKNTRFSYALTISVGFLFGFFYKAFVCAGCFWINSYKDVDVNSSNDTMTKLIVGH